MCLATLLLTTRLGRSAGSGWHAPGTGGVADLLLLVLMLQVITCCSCAVCQLHCVSAVRCADRRHCKTGPELHQMNKGCCSDTSAVVAGHTVALPDMRQRSPKHGPKARRG